MRFPFPYFCHECSHTCIYPFLDSRLDPNTTVSAQRQAQNRGPWDGGQPFNLYQKGRKVKGYAVGPALPGRERWPPPSLLSSDPTDSFYSRTFAYIPAGNTTLNKLPVQRFATLLAELCTRGRNRCRMTQDSAAPAGRTRFRKPLAIIHRRDWDWGAKNTF